MWAQGAASPGVHSGADAGQQGSSVKESRVSAHKTTDPERIDGKSGDRAQQADAAATDGSTGAKKSGAGGGLQPASDGTKHQASPTNENSGATSPRAAVVGTRFWGSISVGGKVWRCQYGVTSVDPDNRTVEIGSGVNKENAFQSTQGEVLDPAPSGDVTLPHTIVYNNDVYTVNRVGSMAFWQCYDITSTGLADKDSTILSIGREAYNHDGRIGETGLAENSSVTLIDGGAFSNGNYDKTGLADNDSVKQLRANAFDNDQNLKTTGLEKNKSVTDLGMDGEMGPFYDCKSLTSTGLTTNTTVTSIGARAFHDCPSLGKEPDVNGNTNLYDLVLNAPEIKDKPLTIGIASFDGTNYDRLYLNGPPESFKLVRDSSGAKSSTFTGSKITKVFVPPSWAEVPTLTDDNITFSQTDGTLVVMTPMKEVSAKRITNNFTRAHMTVFAKQSFRLSISRDNGGCLGEYSVTVPPGSTKVNFGFETLPQKEDPKGKLTPNEEHLSVTVVGQTEFAYPAGATRRSYNVYDDKGAAPLDCTVPAVRYTINFLPNKGSGTLMPAQTKIYGETLKLPRNTYTRGKDFEFTGWNTMADGSGEHLDDQETLIGDLSKMQDATVMLYAQWKSKVSMSLTVHSADSGGALVAGAGYVLSHSSKVSDTSKWANEVFIDKDKTHPVGPNGWPRVSGTDGSIALYGLAPGDYYLFNTMAPAGFQLCGSVSEILIAEGGTVTIDGKHYEPVTPGAIDVTMSYQAAPTLPGTGAFGSGPAQAGACALALTAALGAATLVWRRRGGLAL